MISEQTKEYFELGKRNDVRESAKRLRRQYLRYKDAEIVYSIQHKKLLEMASKADVTKVMRIQRHRNYRSRGVQRSYPYARINPAEIQYSTDNGVSKRKEQFNDLREVCKSQVQIWQQAFLVARILCEYSRKK